MSDLFRIDSALNELPVSGATLLLKEDFISADEAHELMQKLINSTNWRHERVVVWGKSHFQPRLIAWFGDQSYSYSGATLDPNPWTNTLMHIKEKIELITNSNFNSVLLNLYRNGQDCMGAHSDNEAELGQEPEIASVSLGATRKIRFIPRDKNSSLRAFNLPLVTGSLLIMKGTTQKNWLHEIPRQPSIAEPRLNLTFRYIRKL